MLFDKHCLQTTVAMIIPTMRILRLTVETMAVSYIFLRSLSSVTPPISSTHMGVNNYLFMYWRVMLLLIVNYNITNKRVYVATKLKAKDLNREPDT